MKLKLGDQADCMHRDRIEVGLSPVQLSSLIELAENAALSATNYGFQGVWRVTKDILQVGFDSWRKERDRKDGVYKCKV